ncbi:MAG TPA: glycosyltransferase 61 family protein [Dermatophilaceae bacterium]|nr:glycosyltransferase 61 family protein [Dermatophilaceae bacterium]
MGKVLDRRNLRNVAILATGAADADIRLVLHAIQAAHAPRRRLARPRRRDVSRRARAVRRRLRGHPFPLPVQTPGGRQVLVLSTQGRAGWDLQRSGARHIKADTLVDLHGQLKRFGPFDAIIDLSRAADLPHDATWSKLFLHLRDKGVYVSLQGNENPLTARLALVSEGRGDKWAKDAVESVTVHGAALVVEKKGCHYLKLRDHEVDRLLPTRHESATCRVLTTLPAGELLVRTELVSHGAQTKISDLEPVLAYPELRMRLYTGGIAMATHSLLFTEGTMLPETFRHHLHRRLQHRKVTDSTDQFGTLPDKHLPGTRLEGVYYNLNSPFPGHFGHITTEVLSRLWGWDEAKRQFPELKAIWQIPTSKDRDPQLERQLFRAYGIDEEDMVWTDRPVWLSSVVGVTPMWHNNPPHYVHPGMAQVWKRIGANLAEDPGFEASRIFVSRRASLARTCRNAVEVEEVFRRHGFTVVYPEDLSLAQQATTFRNAKVVAGFGGSAMFNVMYAEGLTNLIVLTHEAYTARNEYLFASLLGGRTDYFWSTPETPHPQGGWTQEAFISNWSFDFDRHGTALELLFASLA